jgi:anti-sigma factor RsiW
MDCRTFNRKLEDYLEGGLDFPGRFGMDRHAQQCFACGKTAADAQKIARMARSLKRVTAPDDFEAAVLARIQKGGFARRRTGWQARLPIFWGDNWVWRPVALGAVIVAVLGAGIVFLTRATVIEPDGSVRLMRKDSASPSQIQPGPDLASGTVPMESADVDESPAQGKTLQSNAILFPQESGLTIETDPAAGTDYVEYLVPGPGDRQLIMRLPKTIRMRYGQPSAEYYIRNVSH